MIKAINLILILTFIAAVYNFSLFKPNNNQIKIKADQCKNITHFQFQSNVSLGKNDQANRTFTQLQDKITSLKQVNWAINSSVSYRIFNAKPSFRYRDSNQKAQIVGNQQILIDGGFTETQISFDWARVGAQPKSGSAVAFGLSDEIIFAKKIEITKNDDATQSFRYKLVDYINVTYNNPMSIVRYSTPDISDQDKNNLWKLVNLLFNVTTLKHSLQDEIDRYYSFILSMNVHNENQPIDLYFEYQWIDPIKSKGQLIIPFTRNPLLIDIERDGIHYGYLAQIKGYNNSRCGIEPQRIPFKPDVYGGSQQFMSLTFYENVLKYAIEKGTFNTALTKQNWESKMFQFFAGDLYDIFPEVARTIVASTEVNGQCTANLDHFLIYPSNLTKDTLNVTYHSRCVLNINGKKIIDFDVGLQVTVQGVPTSDYIDFKLYSHQQFVSFYPTEPYKMQNELLARQMVSRSISRLYDTQLFGSGWPLHPQRDYPNFEVERDFTIVYDTTHV